MNPSSNCPDHTRSCQKGRDERKPDTTRNLGGNKSITASNPSIVLLAGFIKPLIRRKSS